MAKKRSSKTEFYFMKTIFFLLITAISFSQGNVVTAGGDIENFSYTVGNNLVELQIPVIEEIALNVPKFELPIEKPIIRKKKTFIQKIIDFIKRLNLF